MGFNPSAFIARGKSKKPRKKVTGKGLEGRIEVAAGVYSNRRVCYLKKVDPPTKTIIQGGKPQTILLENPFLDFVGVWTERAGRLIVLEAKTTSEARLPMVTGGLTQKQIDALRAWHNAGAAVGVIWEFNLNWGWVSLPLIQKTLSGGRKSVPWEDAEIISQGECVLIDFMRNLRRDYPGHQPSKSEPLKPICQPAAQSGAGW